MVLWVLRGDREEPLIICSVLLSLFMQDIYLGNRQSVTAGMTSTRAPVIPERSSVTPEASQPAEDRRTTSTEGAQGQRHAFSFTPQTIQLPLRVLFLSFLLLGTWTFNCSLWRTVDIALIFLTQSFKVSYPSLASSLGKGLIILKLNLCCSLNNLMILITFLIKTKFFSLAFKEDVLKNQLRLSQ